MTNLGHLHREHWARVVATVMRRFDDMALAEECVQEAFASAVAQWPTDGAPRQPLAWLIRVAHFKAVDAIRRRAALVPDGDAALAAAPSPWREPEPDAIADDRLRLIFTCCHPAFAPEARVALTLRVVCGLSTEAIARAFLVPVPTMAQRLVRAQHKAKAARVPYEEPGLGELTGRMDTVMAVIYLIFNEGYSRTTEADLCDEAIRLAELLLALLDERAPGELHGLLALMLLHDARRAARHNMAGDPVLLEDQDRALWDHARIARALPSVERALRAGPGPYGLQAAIAALHARAASVAATDWPQIVGLYDLLVTVQPSPVVALNRAAALAMGQGPEAGLTALEAIDATALGNYGLYHAARADMLRRAGRVAEAREGYAHALAAASPADAGVIAKRLRELEG